MMRAIAVLAVISFVASTSFGAVNVSRININPQQTTAIADYATTGAEMAGMLVTANGTDTVAWAATGVAAGTGWSLSETDDTFNGYWTLLSEMELSSLFIDGAPGDTMFDTIMDPELTPGSARGREFTYISNNAGYNGDINVTYTGPVSLTGDPFAGDMYRYMRIDFTIPFRGELVFQADTDNALIAGDITPGVPAPGALLLASLGSAGVAWFRRRQRA
jgi:hypothetical protein